jgi:hypothetical protein
LQICPLIEVHMTSPPVPHFPAFLQKREALREQATALWLRLPTEKDPPKAQRLLEQLITNQKMKSVWGEIYRTKRGKRGQFFNPARLTNESKAAALREKAQELRKNAGAKDVEDAKYLDFEATLIELLPEVKVSRDWSEQDIAARRFLVRGYRIALDPQPEIHSDLQSRVDKLRSISARLRDLAREIESMGEYVFPYYADKIEDVADDCEDDAKVLTPNLVDSPWLIIRERGNLQLRTIVGRLAYCTYHLFLRILPSTIATVTNVIQECEQTDVPRKIAKRDAVRQILGEHNYLTIRPTFGPLIYPMFQTHDRRYQRSFRNRQSRAI